MCLEIKKETVFDRTASFIFYALKRILEMISGSFAAFASYSASLNGPVIIANSPSTSGTEIVFTSPNTAFTASAISAFFPFTRTRNG